MGSSASAAHSSSVISCLGVGALVGLLEELFVPK